MEFHTPSGTFYASLLIQNSQRALHRGRILIHSIFNLSHYTIIYNYFNIPVKLFFQLFSFLFQLKLAPTFIIYNLFDIQNKSFFHFFVCFAGEKNKSLICIHTIFSPLYYRTYSSHSPHYIIEILHF